MSKGSITIRFANGALIAFACLAVLCAAGATAQRSARTARTLNSAQYEIAVQRNGALSVRTPGEVSLFVDVVPEVLTSVAADVPPRPERLDLSPDRSFRTATRDPLGEGPGFSIQTDAGEWLVQAYPTRTFFSVRFVYRNDTDETRSVHAISPWSYGPRGGLFGGEAREGLLAVSGDAGSGEVALAPLATWVGSAAYFDRISGRTILLGPLSREHADMGAISVETGDGEAEPLLRRRPVCVYDPPRTVDPGGTLASETLYVAVADIAPPEAMRRYLRARRLWKLETTRSSYDWLAPAPLDAALWDVKARRVWKEVMGLPPSDNRSERLPYDDIRIPEPAAPLDVFAEGGPSLFHHHAQNEAGDWNVAASFGVGNGAGPQRLPFGAMGYSESQFLTVLELPGYRYLGTAQGGIDIEVASGQSRLFLLRPYAGRPVFLGHTGHWSMGMLEDALVTWDARSDVLTGRIELRPPAGHFVLVALPSGRRPVSATVDGKAVAFEVRPDGAIAIPVPEGAGPLAWSLACAFEAHDAGPGTPR